MLQWLSERLGIRRGSQRRPRLIRRLEVSRRVLEASRRETAPYPRVETMFLWTGRCDGDACRVRTLVLPRVDRSGGRVRISREEMKRAGRAMRARGEILVLQVHTHPGTVAFSPIDEEEAADQGPGALAMVVHHYGQTQWTLERDTAFYERGENSVWKPWAGRTYLR